MSLAFEYFTAEKLLELRRRGRRPTGETWVVQDVEEAARLAAMRSWAMGLGGPCVVFTDHREPMLALHGLDVVVMPFSYSSNERSLLMREVMRAEPRSMQVVDREDFEDMIVHIVDGLEEREIEGLLTATAETLLRDLRSAWMWAGRWMHG